MMKGLLLAFFSLLTSHIYGQEVYKPFLEDGKVWKYHYYNDFTGKEYYESLTVAGDTIIDNMIYKRIVDAETGSYKFGMCEDGKKVYGTYPHRSGKELLYDFGLKLGDTFKSCATVVSVDTVVVGSHAFRVLDVRSNDDNSWPNWWVEGVGSMYHLTTSFMEPGNCYVFSSCQLNGETILTHKDVRTVGIRDQIFMNGKEKDIPLFDLHGRRFMDKPGKGVYIENGKKRVVK